ncbi:RNA polymerase-associated protein RapA [Exilibacterium tricleocarpae]|uniref:RNA polymerase-associated protein RapA n=1 Tax=Exilibacterium tricleocarpae TaxID=2591008 RepID=A0A545SMF8_9GAMM|nr:RNA polymerase-associated protein RapA [Exilibacterium tricleocarpae]TQV66143.1 RNA polymerase-associated protein RapA [Exilibacterium tricleocarpae]
MNSQTFAKGQRWISNTESELGLGVVQEHLNRRITLYFPANDETRTYADNNAPLTRVAYRAGEQIQYGGGRSLTVIEVMENNGCLIYAGVAAAGSPAPGTDAEQITEQIIVPETELDSDVPFGGPKERLLAGQIDSGRRFQLRRQTLEHLARLHHSPAAGLLGARVELLPHQLYIAAEVAARHAPRVLLADEVGLGKTIEAGLILHQQLLSGRARRALVTVPDSLVHQWLVEMLRRFNLPFTLLDAARCDDLASSGIDNPFDSAQLVLCSLSLLVNVPARLEQALQAQWDLLVVDEAHHLVWSEQQASPAYTAVEALARQAAGLLLLTATPEQLGMESHFARLRLLDPARYHDFDHFRAEQAKYQPVNDLVQKLLSAEAPQLFAAGTPLRAELQHYLGDAAAKRLLEALAGGSAAAAEAVADATQVLLDRHGTGRVLFRNTRAAVAGFPERRLQPHPLAAPDAFTAAAPTAIAERLHPEYTLGPNWPRQDSRVSWLAQWLKAIRPAKVLLICAEAETALDLEEHLRLRVGVRSAVFHEGLSLLERDRAAAYFADDIDGAQILVCSEIGSEGRNFQFAHHMVMFDLPRNPDLLEQRIGRLDRIGQTETVQIHVPYYRDTAQERLLRWYRDGIDGFRRACPAGPAIAERFAGQLDQCLSEDDSAAMTALIDATRAFTDTTLAALQAGRDRLLELNACNPRRARQIIEELQQAEAVEALSHYMEQVLDEFGVEQEHHSDSATVLRPGDHMVVHKFPGLPDDGLTATCDRRTALSREDMVFLSWEHPMVSGAMDLVLSADFGNTAFCTLKLPPLAPGTLLVEAIFVLHSTAPRALQLQRFLPAALTRVVLDSHNNDLSNVISDHHLDQLGEAVPKKVARNLVNHARAEIAELVQQAEDRARAQQSRMLADAVASMQRRQQQELERLQALAAVNPNIRRAEIEHIETSTRELEVHLNNARIKLEALRVAVAT